MKTVLNSNRLYAVAFIENDFTFSHTGITLKDLLVDKASQFEWILACQENIDDILDLHRGERLQMQFNRDNNDSAGYIKRIQ